MAKDDPTVGGVKMGRISLEEYYKNYYLDHGAGSYTMGALGPLARVLTLQKWIKETTPVGGTVLDIGCGDGHLSTLLPQYNWVGLDLNTDKTHGKAIRAINHDIMLAPYPIDGKSVDTVVCSEVLEHVFDLRIIHKEVRRVLKKGGAYILSTPNYDWVDHFLAQYRQLLFDPDKPHLFEHIRQYSLATHTQFLNNVGFYVERHTGSDGQYSALFNPAIGVLQKALQQHGVELSSGEVDMIIGDMFPTFSHTIMMVARGV